MKNQRIAPVNKTFSHQMQENACKFKIKQATDEITNCNEKISWHKIVHQMHEHVGLCKKMHAKLDKLHQPLDQAMKCLQIQNA